MYTLGINAVFHDSAACLLKDGVLIAAAEDERFTGIRHGKPLTPFATYEIPFHAIAYCLQTAGIHLRDVDHIAYSFDPFLLIPEQNWKNTSIRIPLFNPDKAEQQQLWNNLFISSVVNAPGQLVDGYPHHLQQYFHGSRKSDWEWHFVEHHLAHAASAYLPSPFTDAAVMTLDGRGEIVTTTYSLGEANQLTRIGEVGMPHSLGLLYEQVSMHLGFLHSSDEYEVMALASYGRPEFVRDFREMINIGSHGQYTISNENLAERFGPMRLKSEPVTAHHFNIAHSLQLVMEETVLELASWLHQVTAKEHLCMAGGVALNCVLNTRIRDKSSFKKVWVQPAAGDSGTALGAAMWIDQQQRKSRHKDFVMDHAYWGPEYSDNEIEHFLKLAKIPYRKMKDVAEETASLLADHKIIGWFQGRMEYGPRALGGRSILASPIAPELQARLNGVKDSEDFRPVAPVVLEEDAAEWFNNASSSPFMLFVDDVRKDKVSQIPAVKHIDGTARIQTVNEAQHQAFYNLLKAFKRNTGLPVLIITSFNAPGKPIVCSIQDAISSFWISSFDAMVIGSFLIEKKHADKNFG